MLTQFLIVMSVTLLTVGHKAYTVFKRPARGSVAGAYLVAVVASKRSYDWILANAASGHRRRDPEY